MDRDLGMGAVPRAIRAAGGHVELHRDHFPDDAPDVEWIPYAARRGWIILTQDRGIQRRPHERRAVLSAGARYICVAGGSRRAVDTASMVLEQFVWIDGLARAVAPPLIARVTKSGVRLWDKKTRTWVQVRKRHLRIRR